MFLHSSGVSSGLSDSLLRTAAPYYNSFLSLSPPQLELCSWSAEVWMETHIYIRGTCRDCSSAGHNPIGPGCSACKSCVRKESSQDSWEGFCKFDSRGGSSSQECYTPPCLCGKKAGCHKFRFLHKWLTSVCLCVGVTKTFEILVKRKAESVSPPHWLFESQRPDKCKQQPSERTNKSNMNVFITVFR